MLITLSVVGLIILAMLLNALSSSPKPDNEWQIDTDRELNTTTAHVDADVPAVQV